MNCDRVRSLFSSYLDGAVPGRQMQAVSQHLGECAGCREEYAAWQRTQRLLSSLGPKLAPPELALRLRVAISQAAAQRPQRRLQGLLVRIENLADAFMLPATAGLVSAIIFFGVLIGFMALPMQLSASRDDVPTLLYTPPRLQALPSNLGLGSVPALNSEPVVVETLVDANGRVQDYRIISGPADARGLQPELNNIMIFTTFQPATTFGVPTSGRVVLSFAKINVRG
ncbi:MAG TPA: zf-HC2 domain-containing protein [Terriglobales bacterium]|nr:zf-HC2 domain-containing protein [Terriglobales bacterium]